MTPILLERLEIGGVSIGPYTPSPELIGVSYPRACEVNVTLNGQRVVSQAAEVQGAVITLDAGVLMDEAFKAALDAAHLAGTFVLHETYTNRRALRAWLGCTFAAEPQIAYYGEDAENVYYTLKSALTIYAGVPT